MPDLRKPQREHARGNAGAATGDDGLGKIDSRFADSMNAQGFMLSRAWPDKVRIDVARASIGGYQGQEPVVQERSAL